MVRVGVGGAFPFVRVGGRGGWNGGDCDDWLKRWVAIVQGSAASPFPDGVPSLHTDETLSPDQS